MPLPRGWICSRCGRSLSPFVMLCPCKPDEPEGAPSAPNPRPAPDAPGLTVEAIQELKRQCEAAGIPEVDFIPWPVHPNSIVGKLAAAVGADLPPMQQQTNTVSPQSPQVAPDEIDAIVSHDKRVAEQRARYAAAKARAKSYFDAGRARRPVNAGWATL